MLPVLVALYRNDKDNQAAGRRHKTPSDLMRQLLCVLLRWSPTRRCLRETVATPITCGLPHCPNATGKKNRNRLGPANDRDFLRRDHARLPRFVVSLNSSNPCIQADHAKILPSNKTTPVNTDPMMASRDKPLRQFGHLGVGTVALR